MLGREILVACNLKIFSMTKSKDIREHSNPINNLFAILIGAFLSVEGVWGLFSELVFGVFTTNLTHAVIHLVLGVLGIILGIRKTAGGYCTFLGILLVLVGLFWFVPVAGELIVQALNLNRAGAILNILIGIISLSVVYYRRPAELRN
ncbi:hypothetical protein CNR22_01390 [Sphingobacteriaceae bacterium]|nr:hypothetical protein CNR22_01390 [Sphingobacteriaceae bacterium]